VWCISISVTRAYQYLLSGSEHRAESVMDLSVMWLRDVAWLLKVYAVLSGLGYMVVV